MAFDNGQWVEKTLYIGQDIPMNQWFGMPPWKRQHFVTANGLLPLQTWLVNHGDATLEVYMGSCLMDDPCTLHAHGASVLHPVITQPGQPQEPQAVLVSDVPFGYISVNPWIPLAAPRWFVKSGQTAPERVIDPRSPSQISRLWSTFGPWINEAGIRRFWLDAGAWSDCNPNVSLAQRRWGVHELAYNPYLRSFNVRIGAENFPTTDEHARVLDQTAIRQIPYMALDSWLLETAETGPAIERWVAFGPLPKGASPWERSEGHVLIADQVITVDRMAEFRRYNYVLTVMNAMYPDKLIVQRQIQRWYTIGKIRIADFNGDMSVDEADYYDFVAAYALYNDDSGGGPTTRGVTCYATCDLNRDGKVDLADWSKFMAAYQSAQTPQDLYYNGGLGPLEDFGGVPVDP